MAKSLREWRDRVFGKKIDLDNGSYDCVDVPKSWAEYLTGKPWTESLSWGNAKDLFDFNPGTYWHKLGRGTTPQPGDVIVMNGSVGGGFGHTGVIVRVDGNDVVIYEQNTFEQHPIREARWSWKASYVTGFLRPKTAFTVEIESNKPAPAAYQRVVGAEGASYRTEAKTSATRLDIFQPGELIDFKGYVRGEKVEGNDIWFVGRYTGGYSWSGAYTSKSTVGLTDLTPKQLKDNQRQVANDVMNARSQPVLNPGNVQRSFYPGEIVTMKGYVKGQFVDGSDIWFVTEEGLHIHSDGFTNKTVGSMKDLTPVAPPAPEPEPPYDFKAELDIVDTVAPAAIGNFEYGNFPEDPEGIVLHVFGTPGKDTLQSSINTFQNPSSEVSAKYLVEGQTIVQSVALKDRAYHAGPKGNHLLSIEIDPYQSEETKATVRELIAALESYYGKRLSLYTHNMFVEDTDCGTTIDLADYDIHADEVTPEEPKPEEPIEEPPVVDKEPSKEPSKEAAKTIGRNGILGAVSVLIAAGAEWALDSILLLNLPTEMTVAIGGLAYAILLFVDKFIHQKAKELKDGPNGLIGF